VLKVSGRDVDDREIALQWDGELYCWQMVGEAAGVRAQTMQGEIMLYIKGTRGRGDRHGDCALVGQRVQ